jgi:hypothetical protein
MLRSCDWAQVQRESYSWTTQGLSCHIVWHAKTGKHGSEAIEKTIKYVGARWKGDAYFGGEFNRGFKVHIHVLITIIITIFSQGVHSRK